MRVAIDATPLSVSPGGMARYTSALSCALAENFPDDHFVLLSDQRFRLPCHRVNLSRGFGPRNRMEKRWWLWGVEREMSRTGAELFHGTNFATPYLPRCPSVLTLHDLSPWMASEWHFAADRIRRRVPLLIGLRIPTMIITPSESVRRQALEYFRIHPNRIKAVPEAASCQFRPVPVAASTPYFLFVGTLEPRKNLPALIDAWRALRRTYHVDLVLAGRRRPDFPPLAPEPGLRLLGEVPDERLPSLYSGALAFIYPSHYEGFGLPVLEAMQCGACVMISRDSALREVAADAAVIFSFEAMQAAVTNPEWLCACRERSLRRAREFSWSKTARLTREVYEQACRLAADA